MMKRVTIALAALILSLPAITMAAPVVFEASGSGPADIQAAVDEFRRRLLDHFVADQIEHETRMQAALRRERDACDRAGNVAMDMAEEDVADIAVARQHIEQPLRLFEAERVENR